MKLFTRALTLLLACAGVARAEVSEITVAEQFGVSFLPLMVMEKMGLTEKHAKAAGLPLSVRWVQVAGPSVMNDGLLSGSMQFAAQGAPSLITLWERTRRNVGIKGVAAITTYPLYLVTRDPNVHAIQDFTSADKIAVPSVKISTQAIMLEIAAAKAFGADNYAKLDPLTISLAHPDATAAFITGTAGVNTHFSSSPFYEQEIKVPGAHLITTNYEILGGPATALVLLATGKFREANPQLFHAFYDALAEAIEIINKDKPAAARLYIEMSKDKSTPDEILGMIGSKDYAYTLRPAKVMATAQFMREVGTIKEAPRDIADMFFPEAAGLGGD